MTSFKYILIFLGIALACKLQAQERLTISGVEYLVHEVEKKQTLYAISKAYSVSLSDILNANPSVSGGLNAGQRLLIPVAAVNKKAQKSAPVLKNGELTHLVKKKETWYSISKRYNVDLADLLEKNPDKADGLKPGHVVLIPTEKAKSIGPLATTAATEEKGRFHIVKPKETLYGIAKQYDLEVAQIKSLNSLTGNEISIGSALRLPDLPTETVKEPESTFTPILDKKTSYKIGFYLPFSLDRNDSAYVDGKDGLYPLSDISMQFYFGALMALDSLKAMGLTAEVFFEDVNQDVGSVTQISAAGGVDNMDMIIGPFHRDAVEKVAKLTANSNIPVICPVTRSSRILIDRPNMFKAKSGRVEQLEAITTYASKQNTPGNVIIFMPNLEKEKDIQNMALEKLQSKMPGMEIHEIHDFKDVEKFKTHFQLDKMNSVIIPSENHSVVSGLLTKLNGIADKHPMTVYGLQRWADFDNIDLAYKEKLNVHLAMSDWIDRSNPRTVSFVNKFQEAHNNDPSEYAFLGYDVTLYFGFELLAKGPSFSNYLNQGSQVSTLHLPVNLRSTGTANGFRNVGITLVDHKDMVLRKIDISSEQSAPIRQNSTTPY